ncbi:hypothetical protein E2I00_003454, partial [Balaenoptera physalus]
MSSSFFNPSFAFSSHFDPDGAPLSELSWSSSLSVVAVSFSGLFTVIALMLACLCCKKGGIGFKEFENAEGEEYAADFSAQGSPAAAAQNGPDVYVLPLTEVSLPMAKQPGRSVQLLKSTDLGRHSLLYLEEIGHGWFGKLCAAPLLPCPECESGGQPLGSRRALQHSNLLQCLAQCAEVTPYLLVMEFCPMGDLKGYLRSCRVAESMAPDPLTLQRMACEVACGVLHLHRNNYVHRSLGVTIWELFELGAQPYPHHSDRQVLAYAVREQQLKLPKPQLQLTLSDRCEYFIRLEDPAPAAGHDPDCAGCAPSTLAATLRPDGSDHDDDSDGSEAASLVMEPLLGHAPPDDGPWGHFDYYPCRSHALQALDSDSGSSFPELEAPGSEDEDTTEATSGVFTDLSSDGPQAEKPDVTPAFRSLQKQVGTPDSLDSLDIPSSASDGGSEVFSPLAVGTPGGQPRALDSGYDTENYESPEFVLKEAHEPCEPEAFEELASEGESPGPETRLSASLGGLSEKNPYRDSAYFSDLDTEPEPPLGPKETQGGVPVPGPEPDLESPKSPRLPSAQPSPGLGMLGEAQGSGPREVPPLPLPEGSSPEPSACPRGPRLEPPWPQDPAQVPPMPSPGRSKIFLLTPVRPSSGSHRPELQETLALLSGSGLQERTGGPGAPRTPLCLALPAVPAAPEARPEEEEEDSEDSDESDEELRCYSVQEPSEESEEEAPPVPVVVAESQSARNLRSLLKMPNLLSEAFCEDLERKKKAVSFFDDVTVYLFDQ